jgi:beta-lactamase class A
VGVTRLDPELDRALDAVPGTVSIWYGRPGARAAYTRNADATHYAASTMKLAVLAALHCEHEAGAVDLDEEIEVRNEFTSVAPGGGVFGCTQSYDSDDAVWRRLGGSAPLGWLAERMIVRSSNLATNLVLDRIGIESAAAVWPAVGARHSVLARAIDDVAAAGRGIANLVTAADLAALVGAIATGQVASPASCDAMITTLLGQERTEDLVAGLPVGTRVAHKNGWITGVRHSAGIVYPEDAPPFVLVACLSTPWAVGRQDDKACQLVARIATAAWTARHVAG